MIFIAWATLIISIFFGVMFTYLYFHFQPEIEAMIGVPSARAFVMSFVLLGFSSLVSTVATYWLPIPASRMCDLMFRVFLAVVVATGIFSVIGPFENFVLRFNEFEVMLKISEFDRLSIIVVSAAGMTVAGIGKFFVEYRDHLWKKNNV